VAHCRFGSVPVRPKSPIAILIPAGGRPDRFHGGAVSEAVRPREDWAHFDVWAWRKGKYGRPEGGARPGFRAVWAMLAARYSPEAGTIPDLPTGGWFATRAAQDQRGRYCLDSACMAVLTIGEGPCRGRSVLSRASSRRLMRRAETGDGFEAIQVGLRAWVHCSSMIGRWRGRKKLRVIGG